jgi:hypothetical protein
MISLYITFFGGSGFGCSVDILEGAALAQGMDSTCSSSEAMLDLSADRYLQAASNDPPAHNHLERQSQNSVMMTTAAATTMIKTTVMIMTVKTIMLKYLSLLYGFLCTFSQ